MDKIDKTEKKYKCSVCRRSLKPDEVWVKKQTEQYFHRNCYLKTYGSE